MTDQIHIDNIGIQHPDLGSGVLSWIDIAAVDLVSTKFRGKVVHALSIEVQRDAVTRLNEVLPLNKRILMPSVFGALIKLRVPSEQAVQLFEKIRPHVASIERHERSMIEKGLDLVLGQQGLISEELSTTTPTPRGPGSFSDSFHLVFTAILVFILLTGLVIGGAMYFA